MTNWLTQLVRPLGEIVFTIGADQVSWAELMGFLTGGACVALAVRRNVVNFPVGIANSAFYLVLFASARLWADSALQVLYITVGFVGWWQWVGRRTRRGPLRVRRASRLELAACVVAIGIGTVGLHQLLKAAQDAAPLLDALTTSLSLAAQGLLNAKRIETWYFWLAADCVYVPLYVSRHLLVTAFVYVLFLGLCVAGLRAWNRERAQQVQLRVGDPAIHDARS